MVPRDEKPSSFIQLKCMERNQLFKEDHILFAEKSNKTTVTVTFVDGESVQTTTTLKNILLQSSPGMVKVNRSQIVNLRWVVSMRADMHIFGNYIIQLQHCKQLFYASRMYAKPCFHLLKNLQRIEQA